MTPWIFPACVALCVGAYSFVPSCIVKIRRRLRRRERPGKLFLSFDDGPDGTYTPVLLDLLKTHGVRASFFVVAEFAKRHPELIARMSDEGHLVGFHSNRHRNAYFLSPATTAEDFADGLGILRNQGVEIRYFRPPWGNINLSSLFWMRKYGLRLTLWDVMAQDWRGDLTTEDIQRRLQRRTFPGAVICLHDGRGQNAAPGRTIEALASQIPLWLSMGYRFETVERYEEA